MSLETELERAEALLAARQPAAALALFDRLIEQHPAEGRAWQGRGRALNNLQRYADAEAALRKALDIDPASAAGNNYLGHVLRGVGRADEAAQYFRAAIDADGGMAVAHYNLGTVLAMSGDYAGAVAAFEHSLELGHPGRDALLNLGELYQFLERYGDAAGAYRRAMQLEPDDALLPTLLGELYYSLGEVEQARDAFNAALAIDPNYTAAIAGRALLHELWGEIDAGLALVDRARDADAMLDYSRARLLRRAGEPLQAAALLQQLREGEHQLASDPRLYFTLGDTLDELGRYDEAFAAYRHGNELKPAPFDPAAHTAAVREIIDFFDAGCFAGLARADADGSQPVFIVGMPRSGTTLVEQILASHSEVHAGGERFEIPQIVRELAAGWPRCLATKKASDLDALAQRYLRGYGDRQGRHAWTDKLPKNFLYLGLIALLFPQAKVVYCRRDPRDTGLSVYFQNMNFRSDPWTSRLGHIAAYSRACSELMRHWKAVLPLPLHEVQYEEMVGSPDAEIRRMLEFLGLEWQPACLAFHETKRLVNTASYAQVRRPLYSSSMGRWRNYAGFIGPLASD